MGLGKCRLIHGAEKERTGVGMNVQGQHQLIKTLAIAAVRLPQSWWTAAGLSIAFLLSITVASGPEVWNMPAGPWNYDTSQGVRWIARRKPFRDELLSQWLLFPAPSPGDALSPLPEVMGGPLNRMGSWEGLSFDFRWRTRTGWPARFVTEDSSSFGGVQTSWAVVPVGTSKFLDWPMMLVDGVAALPLTLLFVVGVRVSIGWSTAQARLRHGACPHCGYDMGHFVRCPECGVSVPL